MGALALLAGVALVACRPADGQPAGSGGAAALLAAVTSGESKGSPEASGGEKVVYYKYVDESGSIRFVERPEQVPSAQRDGSRIEWKAEPRSEATAKPAASGWERVSRSIANRLGTPGSSSPSARSGGQPEVVLYTTTWCGWCRKTIAHLDQNGIRYDNRDIERDRAAYADLKRKTGSTAVPVIEIDGELVRGFDRDRIDNLLGL
jgi:glutaredoxin-like YruB-family protein